MSQCCTCSTSGRSSTTLLADLGPLRCESKGNVNFEGRLCAPVQTQTSSSKGSLDSQRVCKPQQEPLPEGGFAGSALQEGSGDGEGSNISSFLQQTIHSTQTKPEMAANLGPQCSKQIFECKSIQNGNNSDLLTTRGRLKRRLGCHLGHFTASGTWSVPESHLHVNFMGSKLDQDPSSDLLHEGPISSICVIQYMEKFYV